MADIENSIFNAIAVAERKEHPGICVYPEYPSTDANFPCLTIDQMNNSVDKSTQDSESIENHDILLYELNAYSNKKVGRKVEAKAIMQTADSVMAGFGFARTLMRPIPNISDNTVYRIVARYTAEIDVKTETIYRR